MATIKRTAEMESQVFPVTGMTCASCVRQWTAALERNAVHSLAHVLRADWNGPVPTGSDWHLDPGGGVTGVIGGCSLRVGRAAFLSCELAAVDADASVVGVAEVRVNGEHGVENSAVVPARLLATFAIADRDYRSRPARGHCGAQSTSGAGDCACIC